MIVVQGLTKHYDDGFKALENVDLTIKRGEIFALLGPNGAGKTTLISCICGLNKITEGSVLVDGHDVVSDYRAARSKIGLVPQEIMLDPFSTVMQTIMYARGFYGKAHSDQLFEKTLKDLALWDKRDNKVQQLSGGMKRRVMIAKALMNEPEVLFLDEPTAGVDVELRRGMWEVVRRMQENGTTIILTTHYLEEAQDMSDRVGIINKGEITHVEDTHQLLSKLGHKTLTINLHEPIENIPSTLSSYDLEFGKDNQSFSYKYKVTGSKTGITSLLSDMQQAGLRLADLDTKESSLEEIFLTLTERSNN